MPSFFEDLIQNIPAIFYRCNCDEHWTAHFINEAIYEVCGHPATDFVDNQVRAFKSIVYPADVKNVDARIDDAIGKKNPGRSNIGL